MIYLDHNATSPLDPSVAPAVADALAAAWGNPSSQHRAGQTARRAVELARARVRELLGVPSSSGELIFTSGGTEADNLALRGRLDPAAGRTTIVTSPTEHAAVRESAAALAATDSADVLWVPTDRDGRVAAAALDEVLSGIEDPDQRVAVVSVSWVNNETGVLQPVDELGAVCRRHRVALHVDAVQWVGRGEVRFSDRSIDLLTFSAHKFGGPKGVGGLAVRRGVRLGVDLVGGAQEAGRRGGTENVPGIVGTGAAAAAAVGRLAELDVVDLAARRDRFESMVVAAVRGALVHGASAPRSWNTSSIGVPGVDAETALLMLSERGVFAAAGAACSSGSIELSPVLLAMGVPLDVAAGTLRFSFGPGTSTAELDQAAAIVVEVLRELATG